MIDKITQRREIWETIKQVSPEWAKQVGEIPSASGHIVIDRYEKFLKTHLERLAAEELAGVEPKARHTDPQTSHDAAKSVAIGGKHKAVLEIMTRRHNSMMPYEPMTDEEIHRRLKVRQMNEDQMKVSASGPRSRRAELVRVGYVKDSGRKLTISTGRKATAWVVTEEGVEALRMML